MKSEYLTHCDLQYTVRVATAVVLTDELVTLQMYWPASERDEETTFSELIRGVGCCMLILLSELDSSC